MPCSYNELQTVFDARLRHKLNSQFIADIFSSKQSKGVICALLEIDRVGLLAGEQADDYVRRILMHDNPAGISVALGIINLAYHPELHKLPLFTSLLNMILDRFLTCDDIWQAVALLQSMRGFGLIEADTAMVYQNFALLSLKKENTTDYIMALGILQHAGVLADTDFFLYTAVVYAHNYPVAAAGDLVRLRSLKLLNEHRDFTAVRNSRFPGHCSALLVKMQYLNLIPCQSAIYTYFRVLRSKGKIKVKTEALDRLVEIGLLEAMQRVSGLVYMLITSNATLVYVINLHSLYDLGILRVDNPKFVVNALHLQTVDYLSAFTTILGQLRRRGLFNTVQDVQTVFDDILTYSYYFFEDNFLMRQLARLPTDVVFIGWHWRRIIEICQSQQTADAICEAIKLFFDESIIAPAVERANVSVYIHPQNTHKASIHLCSSQSAIRLFDGYAHKILGNKSHKVFQVLYNQTAQRENYLNKLEYPNIDEPTWMPKAAMSFLDSIVSCCEDLEPDPVSGIRLDQLIILVWVAIHDHKSRTAKLRDAKNKFFEAMFEARRDSNNCSENSDKYIDDFKPDSNACPSGAFNKFIEKLVSIHPYIFWLFITNQGATDKVFFEVPRQIKLYLKEQGVTQESELPEKKDILTVIMQRMKEIIFFEYGSLFISQKNDLIRFNKSLLRYNSLQELQAVGQDYAVFEELLTQNNNETLNRLIESIECFDIEAVISDYIKENANLNSGCSLYLGQIS